ncbi:MAG: DNA mismatch repair endonuclease MutL, partial [Thiotrichales bacterium]|nr:DNA mismatch repair endonuclease MutL [Thiotrichales bacterium]
PASVVKELLENAIDARADRIRLDLDRGGIRRIRINDNGHGIHPDDLEHALDRHATSKVRNAQDLQRLQSLGFRGEALGAIASVAHLQIQSAADDSGQGRMVQSDAGNCSGSAPVAHRQGTTVEVADLFFNLPARRKFLRTEWTEYQHCQSVIRHIALSHFDIAFSVYHNGRRAMHFPAVPTGFTQRIGSILGKTFMQRARYIDFSSDTLRVWGWLGHPDSARSQSDRQYVYLNGRVIRDKQVSHAVRIAYADTLYTGRFPCYALFIEMDPGRFDINVHPAKHEVRFSSARDVHDFIHVTVLRGLNDDNNEMYGTGHDSHEYSNETNVHSPERVQERPRVYDHDRIAPSHATTGATPGKVKCILHDRFLLMEDKQGVILFDIHALRTQLLRETLDSIRAGDPVTQKPLLFPASAQSSPAVLDAMEDDLPCITGLGIDVSRQGPDRLVLKQLPEALRWSDPEALLRDIIDLLQGGSPDRAAIERLLLTHANDRSDPVSADETTRLLDIIAVQDLTPASGLPLWRRLSGQDLLSLLA